ncbi:MAG: glycine oxidase ThiO [Dehalococcoidia bacterium]|nr:glycine oxidase ThiO [Dehalococcoidia bacterium]
MTVPQVTAHLAEALQETPSPRRGEGQGEGDSGGLCMQHHPDVIVIGGGVIGCAVAYHLSKAGARVTVLERESLACQASGVAAGLLTPLAEAEAPSPLVAMGVRCLALHRALAQELLEATGISVEYQSVPVLRLAFTNDDVARLKRSLEWQQELGLRVSWVDSAELQRLEPQASPDILGGLYSQDEAQLEAYPYTLALARGAEQRGAQVIYAEVKGIRLQGERAVGVETARGLFSAGAVVVAMGPWSTLAGQWLGMHLPVEPLKGQLLRALPSQAPMRCVLFHHGDYVAPKSNGTLILGTTEERVGFDKGVTEEGRRHIVEAAQRLVPGLRDAREMHAIAGLRPITSDGMPIIGKAPHLENVYVATGHGRRGVTLSPATGQAIADLVLRGATDVPIQSFSPGRFATP